MPTNHTDHPQLRRLIREVPNFHGVLFYDIMPIFRSFDARRSAFLLMQEKIDDLKINLMVGLESRGFFFVEGLADRMQLGFVPARKKGKLPPPVITIEYDLEYRTGDAIELPADAIRPGENVLVVDDLLATGGSAGAVCELVKKLGGIPIVLVLIELEALGGRARLEAQGIRVESVLVY